VIADLLSTTPQYLMGWIDDPNDYDKISNDNAICPPNDFDGNYEDWVKAKLAAEKDYENELMQNRKNALELADFFINNPEHMALFERFKKVSIKDIKSFTEMVDLYYKISKNEDSE